MQKHLYPLLLASVLASCATGEPGERARRPTNAEVACDNSIAPEEDPIACFTRIALGSRFPRRTCYRIAELKNMEGREQNGVDLMQIDGLLDSPFQLR